MYHDFIDTWNNISKSFYNITVALYKRIQYCYSSITFVIFDMNKFYHNNNVFTNDENHFPPILISKTIEP